MRKFFTFASLVALMLSACSKEVAQSEAEGKGSVVIALDVETNIEETRTNVNCTTPELGDFSVRIEGITDASYVADYDSVEAFNENNSLFEGSYRATVTAGNINDEGYDKATFVGSATFDVEARDHKDVNITALIANAMVKVEVTDAFKAYFTGGHSLTLTTAVGNEFDVTEQSAPIFIAPTSFTISGTAVKQPNQSGAAGTTVTLPEVGKSNLAAQTLYTVKLDVENAGQATLVITLNDEVEEVAPIEQELNDNAQ